MQAAKNTEAQTWLLSNMLTLTLLSLTILGSWVMGGIRQHVSALRSLQGPNIATSVACEKKSWFWKLNVLSFEYKSCFLETNISCLQLSQFISSNWYQCQGLKFNSSYMRSLSIISSIYWLTFEICLLAHLGASVSHLTLHFTWVAVKIGLKYYCWTLTYQLKLLG